MTARPRSATITSLPRTHAPASPAAAFDPTLPAPQRRIRLTAALPPPLPELLAQGRTDRRPRFGEDGFDGMIELWSPPSGVTPAQAALARQTLEELSGTVLAPADSDHLLGRVLTLLSHFPAKGLSPEVERMMALDWADDLGEYPAWVIDAAARNWRRSRKWRPSIAEMRTLCEEICAPERALADRLQSLADAAPDPCVPDPRALATGALRRMG
ncbi:hypothetical protein J2848_006858 [Azospirillum lipoferum]|uniref:Uncharacterized protein n=1 Tax=Azospirillum lipoferum TaxID=193 RepID=A0A5A9FVA6_AZOLI|nr:MULTISPECIES: hypothetical protein [Azospirillum]KAA0585931.1 hypothetical protein FZ942_35160 [Azospirillum lipoferum]MCP1615145.1 hypothetical protein [Azospirillum lipoferum]MDW5533042.1 hypothetical protein [Azospirillum sp. NL1]